jgi:hypothetical protein
MVMAKNALNAFPQTLNITKEIHGERNDDYLAYATVEEAVVEDGPTFVAEYRLMRVRKVRKETVDCEK